MNWCRLSPSWKAPGTRARRERFIVTCHAIWMVLAYLLHTTCELCLSPVGLSAVTKLAVPSVVGVMIALRRRRFETAVLYGFGCAAIGALVFAYNHALTGAAVVLMFVAFGLRAAARPTASFSYQVVGAASAVIGLLVVGVPSRRSCQLCPCKPSRLFSRFC